MELAHTRERRTCDVCGRKIGEHAVTIQIGPMVYVLCDRPVCKRRFDVQYPHMKP